MSMAYILTSHTLPFPSPSPFKHTQRNHAALMEEKKSLNHQHCSDNFFSKQSTIILLGREIRKLGGSILTLGI